MALIQKTPSQKKLVKLTLVLSGILLATAAVLYYGFYKDDSSTTKKKKTPIETTAPEVIIEGGSGYQKLDELEKISSYNNLRVFGRWPLSVQNVGNTAPFVEINKEISK